jgi:hypothetical protein
MRMSSHDLTNWPLFRSLLDEGASDDRKSSRCFVAGPFDADDPVVREHAFSVLKYVIRPALLDSEHAPRRVETLDSEERIAKATVDALLLDPVAIVIASERSFSIDYALNVNQAMKRPVIFLVEEGRPTPPHAAGATVVTYSFRPEALIGQANIRGLQLALTETFAALAQGKSARDQAGSPEPVVSPAAMQAPASAPHAFSDDDRAALIVAARRRIDIKGIANLPMAIRPDILDFTRSEAARGIEIRVLQCAPGNPGLPAIVGARDMQQLALAQGEIEAAAEAWRRIAESPHCKASITLRRAQTAVPLSAVVLTESVMAASPYLFSRGSADGPSYVARAGTPEFDAIASEFEALWGDATTLFRSEPKADVKPAVVLDQPPFSASFSPVQRASSQPAPAVLTQPADVSPPPSATETSPAVPAGETPRTGPAVIPPSSSGLLKGFSSLRGVTSN